MKVLWLRPSKGDNISVRRERIGRRLEDQDFEITLRDASWLDALGAGWEALTGNYDVIAGNVRMGLFVGYLVARVRRKPILGDVSDPQTDIEYLPEPLYRFFCWYEWQVLKRVDAAVFVYESSYQEALDRGITEAVKLPNVVDYEVFANPHSEIVSEAGKVLNSADVSRRKPVAIYVGGFSHSYHIEDIIKAARLTPGWEFVFVGEGKLESTVADAADEIENVHYPGSFRYELMPGFLAHADAGFCFKDAEQPLKLKEYGAAGIPVIVQPGELEKWYDEDELVFVEPTGSAIASVLEELEDEDVAASYARNLRKAMDDRTWADVADEYKRLFEGIADER